MRDTTPPKRKNAKNAVVIGAGPSGLTAAYELSEAGIKVEVLEKNELVGGIARTENYQGYLFDMGGHRFFSKSKEVNDFWRRLLGDRLLTRPRQSRIYYRKKFFQYPIKAFDAFLKLGLVNSLLILLSCFWWKAFPYTKEENFEQWVTNRFGKRLFNTFFKTYTEKVWGISCTELSADWASQRIKGLSLKTTFLSALGFKRGSIKSLIEEFLYPQCGPGMMWQEVANQVQQRGGVVRLQVDVTKVYHDESRITGVEVFNSQTKQLIRLDASDFVSSMPLGEFVMKMDPQPPVDVIKAAESLSYRDFLTVCLIVDSDETFSDNWIYIHDPSVKVGRIQNYKNWSSSMVPEPGRSSLGLEYFCNQGDSLWNMNDGDLIQLGIEEIASLGLVRRHEIMDGCVFRVEKAYPIYNASYRDIVRKLKNHIQGFPNLQTIGRNGLHRYNNQDHAMLSGMMAARNLIFGETNDVWSINEDKQYHEEVSQKVNDPTESLGGRHSTAGLSIRPSAQDCASTAYLLNTSNESVYRTESQ